MHITLTPQRSDDRLEVSKAGDILTINGQQFDFTSLPDGAIIPAGDVPSPWVFEAVKRIGGVLHLTLILPHGPNPSLPVAFPAPLVNPPDGALTLPSDPIEEAADVDA